MRYTPSQIIRARARECLLGHYHQAVWAYFLISILEFVIYCACASFVSAESTQGRIIYIALNVLYFLIAYIFFCGASFLSLKLSSGQDVGTKDLFQGYRMKTATCAALFLIQCLFVSLCFSPAVLFAVALSGFFRHSTVMVILSMLCCIGLVFAAATLLSLSQVSFVMWDYPGYDHKRIIKTSIRIMKGNRLRLLYLLAGFIPLYLLCLLSFGIGFLWLTPYYRETLAQFYLEIVRNPERPGSIVL